MVKVTQDIILSESLSFDCMVKLKESPRGLPGHRRVAADLNFEFSSRAPASPSPGDILLSNNQLKPHRFPLKGKASGRSESMTSPTSSCFTEVSTSNISSRSNSSSSQSSTGKNRSKAELARVVPKVESIMSWEHFADAVPSLATVATNKRVSRRATNKWVSRRASDAGVQQEKRKLKKEAKRPKGLFGSVMAACRQCQAVEPEKSKHNKA